ncbi:hypothetical protein BDV95DRAFT_299092 [Massariosphaeria phaeospora]|uniref:NACHT domain-containing protein n=1 Tax=Massariosphaeria phaeospora TaxID=100035 RepID=A0A7C8MD85_9PLEO|nr:hypothetical protein BDV95DRAFT_299092 [Massariosphaeria phaeospora]
MSYANQLPSTSGSANEAFNSAFRRFFDSLPERERRRYAPCASSEDLLEGLKKLKAISLKQQSMRFSRMTMAIQTFNDRLRPYFAAIGTLVQAKPEFAALFWGSMRLILQLVDNVSGFFDKVTHALAELSGALPQYDDISRLFKQPMSSRMISHLEGVYGSLFGFFQIIAEVFSKSDGTMKRKSAVAWDLMWTPVDVRFKDVLESLRRHQRLVKDELAILQALTLTNVASEAEHERMLSAEERRFADITRQQVSVALGKIEEVKTIMTEEHKIRKFHDLHRWIDPPSNYSDALENSSDLKQEGTCAWVQTISEFQDWMNATRGPGQSDPYGKFGSNVLWIRGSPGTGKTVLASSIVQELQLSISAELGISTAYYFFSAEVGNERITAPASAYRAILSQILHQNRDRTPVIDKFSFSNMYSSMQPRASQKDLVGLLQLCAQELGHIYIVLDGVDECSDQASLLETITQLSVFPVFRILLLGRPSIKGLYRRMANDRILDMGRFAVSDDIKTYLLSNITSLTEQAYLPNIPLDPLVEHLLTGADGMFLWAKLMIKLLYSPTLTPAKRLSMIKEISHPEGLDQLYSRILALVSNSNRLEKAVAKQVFCWLTYEKIPTTVRLLYEVVHASQLDHTSLTTIEVQDFREMIAVVCGALVEVSGPVTPNALWNPRDILWSLNCRVRFVHLSVKEHFAQVGTSDATVSTNLIMEHGLANMTIAQQALKVILSPQAATTYDNDLPRYSIFFWSHHLGNCTTHDNSEQFRLAALDFTRLLSEFLGKPSMVMKWIHSYYHLGGAASHGQLPYQHLRVWLEWIKSTRWLPDSHSLLHSLDEFIQDMARLVTQWGSKLQDTPDVLWDETASFLNSRFLVNRSLTGITSLASNEPTNPSQSTKPLGDISTASNDGKLNFRLSVWPPKLFEDRWHTLKPDDSATHVRDVCSGWSFRYEVWSTEVKSCVGQIEIGLDETEIWCAMQQLLFTVDDGSWQTAFPMAISSSGYLVSILRTVYSLKLSAGKVTAKKAVLPIDFTDKHCELWSARFKHFDPKDAYFENNPIRSLYKKRYRYSLAFSPSGKYLLYFDSFFSGIGSHYAVFNITHTPDLQLHRLNYASEALLGMGHIGYSKDLLSHSRGYSESRKIDPQFHPKSDLVLVCSSRAVYVWSFLDSGIHVSQLAYGRILDKVHDMKTSECGMFVVLAMEHTLFQKSSTVVVPIPPELAQTLNNSQPPTVDPSPTPASDLVKIGSTDLSTFGISKGQVLSNNTCILRPGNGITGHVLDLQSGDTPSIRLTQFGGSTSQSLELLSLPLSTNIQHTEPTALMPKSDDEPLRIIINAKSRMNYTFNDEADRTYPALIERQVQFAQAEQGNLLNPNRKRLRIDDTSYLPQTRRDSDLLPPELPPTTTPSTSASTLPAFSDMFADVPRRSKAETSALCPWEVAPEEMAILDSMRVLKRARSKP